MQCGIHCLGWTPALPLQPLELRILPHSVSLLGGTLTSWQNPMFVAEGCTALRAPTTLNTMGPQRGCRACRPGC